MVKITNILCKASGLCTLAGGLILVNVYPLLATHEGQYDIESCQKIGGDVALPYCYPRDTTTRVYFKLEWIPGPPHDDEPPLEPQPSPDPSIEDESIKQERLFLEGLLNYLTAKRGEAVATQEQLERGISVLVKAQNTAQLTYQLLDLEFEAIKE